MHAQVYRSIWRKSHYDVIDKDNNITSEGLDRHYHNETDIISNTFCISAGLTGRAGIFVIMSVKAFRSNVIVFIDDVIMWFTSDWPINLSMHWCKLRTDLIFLWINTLSVACIKGIKICFCYIRYFKKIINTSKNNRVTSPLLLKGNCLVDAYYDQSKCKYNIQH
jgi:hypothetical protein